MSGPFGSSQWMYASGEAESQSLRFNDDDSAYLSWTPTSAGNRKTWTWSAWVKRGNITKSALFTSWTTSGFFMEFSAAHDLDVYDYSGSYQWQLKTNQVFRDVSSWYHIVLSFDSTQATAADRVKIYVNGEEVTSFSASTYPSLNYDSYLNQAQEMRLGNGASVYSDIYLAEVNFVDGTALDPTSFGETDANGQWVPIIEPDVTYGTNGFYLPFTNDYEVEGFNTVTYRGNGGTQYVGGVGFEPDFVWVKERGDVGDHKLYDTVRGATKVLESSQTGAEGTDTNGLTAFNSDGFTLGSSGTNNGSGDTYVAWAWDMGTGSAVSNTDGSITSSVKANPDYGQSVVTWTGTGTTVQETIGVGLNWSGKNKLVITKNRDSSTYNWGVNSSVLAANKVLSLNTTNNDSQENSSHYITYETDGFRTYNGGAGILNQSGQEYIAYCFHSVAGYSDIGSYTGNGSTSGPTITTGFKPAFVIIKRTDVSGENWHILDNTRSPYGEVDNYLYPNLSNAEYAGNNDGILITGTSFQLSNTYSGMNASGGTYIYMAFADKREAAFWLDQSGNNNDWTNNNMQESDISLDSPTNNFATLNPTYKTYNANPTFSEGNLTVAPNVANYQNAISTIGVSSGKWYAEIYCNGTPNSANYFGIGNDTEINALASVNNLVGYTTGGFGIQMYADDKRTNNSNTTGYSSAFASGDIMNIAMDLDNGKVWFGKNGTYFSSGDPAAGTNEAFSGLSGTFYVILTMYNAGFTSAIVNFGQDSSFAGNETAQGNQDGNGKGDFYYEPPSGYLALCTDNLPDPEIADPSEHFNTVLYTGDGTSSRSITGVGFQPDFVWLKTRSVSDNHLLQDAVRGNDRQLISNDKGAELNNSTTQLLSFDSDGFTIGSDSGVNGSSRTFVAWNWKADNTSGSSNTDGDITSTVSANTTAGFSIVSWTGNGTSGSTVGHGLSQEPQLILQKNRDNAFEWASTTTAVDGSLDFFYLDLTNAAADVSSDSNSDTVFTVYDDYTNQSGANHIAYCFHSVEGYSKLGSYTGNGSADGPFVYTGFRPAFVIIKNVDNARNWHIKDTQRDPYNFMERYLNANDSSAEGSGVSSVYVDYLSNGFKMRGTSTTINESGSTHIYMAFAENPFKYSNAR
jgi:hypothetical protein